MPLIECPECGREVSSSAASCPECAYPVGTATPAIPPRAMHRRYRREWWKIALPILGRLGAGFILFVAGAEENEVTGVIGGVIIAGSAIPAWYRDKIERLKASRGDSVLSDRIEDRIAEMEQRHQEQMGQLEEMHTGQIAELEERVDFAERLLTERREQIGPG